jgi:hypothetical protein
MINIFNKKRKKLGYFEDKKYYDNKGKIMGSLESGMIKLPNGNNLVRFDEHDNILMNNEQIGFLLDSKVYYREEPLFEIVRNNGTIKILNGTHGLILEGQLKTVQNEDLIGIVSLYMNSIWWEKAFY